MSTKGGFVTSGRSAGLGNPAVVLTCRANRLARLPRDKQATGFDSTNQVHVSGFLVCLVHRPTCSIWSCSVACERGQLTGFPNKSKPAYSQYFTAMARPWPKTLTPTQPNSHQLPALRPNEYHPTSPPAHGLMRPFSPQQAPVPV